MGRPSDIRTVLEILDQRIMKEGWQEQGSMEVRPASYALQRFGLMISYS